MSNPAALEQAPNASNQKIRVMLVDDSAVVRGLIGRWLEGESNIEIAARCHNGLQAVREIANVKPDLVILDIEMPEMDGLEALPLLIKAAPQARILIASSLSKRNAEISLTALAKGAHDYIAKPSTNSDLTTSAGFRVDLIMKINALCGGMGGKPAYMLERTLAPAADAGRGAAVPTPSVSPARQAANTALPVVKIPAGPMSDTAIDPANLRKYNRVKPEILCIGSSTGGPRAVQTVLTAIAPHIAHIPVVLTQHMPGTFTSVFAGHLDKALPVPVSEAVEGETLQPGHIYVAPGGRHLMFKRNGSGGAQVILDNGPEVNFCKPAVDNMFMSACQIYGGRILGVILTGMGQDGAAGGKLIADAGGNILAQDAASSIVWGMPGAAYKTGICAGVFSLNDIGAKVVSAIQGGAI